LTKTLNKDDVVVEISTEDIINDAVTGKKANARSEVIRTDSSLNHDGDVRAIDDTSIVELRAFIA
jgi:hypothetical protein